MNGSPLDLRPEDLLLLQTILRGHVPRCMVWAFGSRATGTAKPASDLDLAIACGEPCRTACDSVMNMKTLSALQDAFAQSTLPIKVDIVDWAETNPSFRKIIDRQKILIQVPEETPTQ